MNTPRICPICAMEPLDRVMLDAELYLSLSGQPFAVRDFKAYRCRAGHFFIVPIGPRIGTNSMEGVQGYGIFL